MEKYLTELIEFSQKHIDSDFNCETSVKSNKSNKSVKSVKSDNLDKLTKKTSESSGSSGLSGSEISGSQTSHYDNKLNSIYCINKCYVCWVDKVLKKFFYILLITAKFIGSGEVKDPNLLKMSEYYSNIIYTYIKINDLGNGLDEFISFEFFDNYIEYKNKLNYSIIELKINSDTLEEIINFLDDYILNTLSRKKNDSKNKKICI